MPEQEPPTEPIVGLPDQPGPAEGVDGQRQTVPLGRRWTASAPVPVPVPQARRRLFRRRPPADGGGGGEDGDGGHDTTYEATLDMPAEELVALLRGPAPQRQLPAPPGWPPPPRPWTPAPGQPPAPRWAPPRGWAPPSRGVVRRRRRRWPWVVLTISLLSVACCCGIPALIAKPFIDEYPAKVATPAQAAGLVRVDDAAARRLIIDMKRRVRSEYLLAEDVFAAVYTEPETDGENVNLLGAARLTLDPDKDLKSALGKLSRFTVTESRPLDAGRLGGELRCGQASGEDSTVVCGWADHGSIGVAVFTGRSTEESAELLRGLRAAVVTRS
jgi:hypothetical protein